MGEKLIAHTVEELINILYTFPLETPVHCEMDVGDPYYYRRDYELRAVEVTKDGVLGKPFLVLSAEERLE